MVAGVLEQPVAETEAKRSFRIGDLICVMHFTRIETGRKETRKVWWTEVRQANGTLRKPPEMYVLIRDWDYWTRGVPTSGDPAFQPIPWLVARHFMPEQYAAIYEEIERARRDAWSAHPALKDWRRVFFDRLPAFEAVE